MNANDATQTAAKPTPAPADFVFQRWAELTDDDPPWWSRPAGTGLRLLLEELGELATARSNGSIAKEAINSLINEARRYVFTDQSLCRRRYHAASEAIRTSLSDTSAENWLPGAAGPSAMAAALQVIDNTSFLPTLLEVLDEEIDKASGVNGENELAQALTEVEAVIELLDAELIRDGHSRQWRQHVAKDAQQRAAEGGAVSAAIWAALDENSYGENREFDCLAVAVEYEEPPVGRLGNALEVEEALARIIRPWDTPDLEAILEEFELLDAKRLLRYQLRAADLDAAAREVSHDFTRDADLWRLRGGVITPSRNRSLLIYDAKENATRLLDLPVEPLDVLPRRLGGYAPDPSSEPTRVDDALVQLAQARLAPSGTAIVNVWTAAEALFGGVVGESVVSTIDVVAGLAEYLYLLDLFRWLGERYEAAGVEGTPGVESSRWGFERTLEQTTDVLAALAASGDALGWWRMKTVTGWKAPRRLRDQLSAFGDRTKQVGARAYLARNTVVHNAEVRRRLVEITLPTFAGVVRECVGFISTNGGPDESLRTATTMTIAVRHAANRVADGAIKAHEGIESLLPDEPGMQLEEVASQDAQEPTAATPGELVPVEGLEGDDAVTEPAIEDEAGDPPQAQREELGP